MEGDETSFLVSNGESSMNNQNETGDRPEWGKYGLSPNDRIPAMHNEPASNSELFAEEASSKTMVGSAPWWTSHFFLFEPRLFGTWDGVFTSCLLNIFGVIIFLRTGWMVGEAGIYMSFLIIILTVAVALISALSAIGVCQRCKSTSSGGVYFLLSHVLGERVASTVGILYCFGQATACSLFASGFGDSVSHLVSSDAAAAPWISRGVAVFVVVVLLVVNLAGVLWVVRLQLLLLFFLIVSFLDFVIGSFVHDDPDKGFLGFSVDVLQNNTGPAFTQGQNFFTVLGVFFPTMTGVMAGVNMSGDLKLPAKNIPTGTLTAIASSLFIYIVYVLILGSSVDRDALLGNYMIAQDVSLVGVLWLSGLYISSLSSCLGSLYGGPRILQSIASSQVIPLMAFLAKGRGPNRVPINGLLALGSISVVFILIGGVNTLGPVVTMPFMITYAAVDYAFFALTMSPAAKGLRSGEELGKEKEEEEDEEVGVGAEAAYGALPTDPNHELAGFGPEIVPQPRSWYSILHSHWTALIGAIFSVFVMFLIQWIYALVTVFVSGLLYYYIGHFNPGLPRGVADYSLLNSLKIFFAGMRGGNAKGSARVKEAEQVIVTRKTPLLSTKTSQLTDENEDFKAREKYHQSMPVEGEKYNDFDEGE